MGGGDGVGNDWAALSLLFAPHSSPGLILTFPIAWRILSQTIGDNINQVAPGTGKTNDQMYYGEHRSFLSVDYKVATRNPNGTV